MQKRMSRLIQYLLILCCLLTLSGVAKADLFDAWQWRNPLPQGNSLRGITYGNGIFVAVGAQGTILASTDGTNWTIRSSGVTTSLNKITYGNGTFIAVGDSGTILTSPDGITWTSHFSGSTNYLTSVAYGNGTFVVVGGSGTILRSTDATSWTSCSSGTTNDLWRVIYGNNVFVAVGDSSTILTSTDFNNWTSRYNWTPGMTYYGVGLHMAIFANNIFVAMGNDGVTFTSTDGINWAISMSGASQPIFGATYGNNMFIAVGYRNSISSTDGRNWTNLSFGKTEFLDDVAFGNGAFVAVGQGGAIYNSIDAINWTSIQSGPIESLNCITYGNGTFVVVGDNGTILTSPNATNWVSNGSGTTERLSSATYSNGIFVAVGNNNTILTSADGYSWTNRSPISMENFYLSDVTYGNGLFVAVGRDSMGTAGSIVTSDDAVNWVIRSSASTPLVSSVAFGDGIFVAVGNNSILTSSDGISWTSHSSGIMQPLTDVAYGNKTFVAVGFDGIIVTSSDGLNWTNQSSGTLLPLTAVTFGNGTFAAVGFDNHIFSSSDGLTWTAHSLMSGWFNNLAYGDGTFVLVGSSGRILQNVTSFAVRLIAGTNGSITGPTNIYPGDNASYSFTPAEGYHVADVLVDGVSAGAITSYTFSNVTADHIISATFAINTFIISTTSGANGSLSGPATISFGDSAGYTITPATGYHIADVLVDGVSVGAVTSYNFTNVTTGHTISASFAINSYNITATAGANGSIAGPTTVNYGESVSYSITPATGYHVADVLVDGASVGPVTSYTFNNVTANHTVSASFAINSYSITATAGANGSSSGPATVNHGGSASYPITPSTGYHVSDVLVDGVSVGAVTSYTFANVAANHTISASFDINSYSIIAAAGANGSSSGPATVNHGGSASYSITPSTGYHVADVLVDGVSVGAVTSYTFANVAANHSISASFDINSYSISAAAGANGSISGPTTVNHGSNASYSISPAVGYHVANVIVDGDSVGAVTNYSFSNVTANHTISASFAINSYSITATAGANGTISGPATVNYGTGATYTITPIAGYRVVNVLVDGVSVGAVSSYSFTNVMAVHTISATFAALADLTVNSVTGPSYATRGKSISVSSSIKNQGRGAAGSFTVSFYLSKDAGITRSDKLLGTKTVTSLSSGSTILLSGNFTVPSTIATGKYYIGVIVDSGASIIESNEANNSKAAANTTEVK